MSSNQCPHVWPCAGQGIRLQLELGGHRIALRRFGEVAALNRSDGTEAASSLAPGRCRRSGIVGDRCRGRAVGQRTEHRPDQNE
jgi:hypothetical protein